MGSLLLVTVQFLFQKIWSCIQLLCNLKYSHQLFLICRHLEVKRDPQIKIWEIKVNTRKTPLPNFREINYVRKSVRILYFI